MINLKVHYTDESMDPGWYQTVLIRMPAVPRVGEHIALVDGSAAGLHIVTRVDHLVRMETERAIGIDIYTTPAQE